MRIKEVGYIVERLADRFRDLGGQMAAQEAAHKTALEELRAGFNARIASDKHRLENLREEIIRLNEAHGRTMVERDALRAEVAALQERLRASIARSDFAQMEVAALKSQTPKHPVKVGEWVKAPLGTRGKVVSLGVDYLEVELTNGPPTRWWPVYMCEPCDPPQTVPVPKRAHPVAVGGHLRRLTGFNTTPAGEVARVTLVDDDDPSQLEYEVVRPNGQKGRWSAKGCEPCDQPATHDTEAGKAVAESALKTEPVERGDLVKVFQATGSMTDAEDIGCGGVVHRVDVFFVWLDRHYTMGLPREGVASLSDVRKVTT